MGPGVAVFLRMTTFRARADLKAGLFPTQGLSRPGLGVMWVAVLPANQSTSEKGKVSFFCVESGLVSARWAGKLEQDEACIEYRFVFIGDVVHGRLAGDRAGGG